MHVYTQKAITRHEILTKLRHKLYRERLKLEPMLLACVLYKNCSMQARRGRQLFPVTMRIKLALVIFNIVQYTYLQHDPTHLC